MRVYWLKLLRLELLLKLGLLQLLLKLGLLLLLKLGSLQLHELSRSLRLEQILF